MLGAVLITATPGEPPTGGPWIASSSATRTRAAPAARCCAAALALAARDGLPAVGLAVTHGNPALRVYEGHGFAEVLDSLTVEL